MKHGCALYYYCTSCKYIHFLPLSKILNKKDTCLQRVFLHHFYFSAKFRIPSLDWRILYNTWLYCLVIRNIAAVSNTNMALQHSDLASLWGDLVSSDFVYNPQCMAVCFLCYAPCNTHHIVCLFVKTEKWNQSGGSWPVKRPFDS